MTTATEYRAMAEECFKWARGAKTDNTRSSYLEIAKIWLAAAAHQDGELPIRFCRPAFGKLSGVSVNVRVAGPAPPVRSAPEFSG